MNQETKIKDGIDIIVCTAPKHIRCLTQGTFSFLATKNNSMEAKKENSCNLGKIGCPFAEIVESDQLKGEVY